MSEKYRKPTAFVIEEPDAKAHATPLRKPRAITGIEFPPDEPAGELTVLAPAPPRKSTAWRRTNLVVSTETRTRQQRHILPDFQVAKRTPFRR